MDGLIVILVVAAFGGIGYWIYKRKQDAKTATTDVKAPATGNSGITDATKK